jgi:hypothetical protein
MGAFIAVAVVVFVLVIAGIAFGTRSSGRRDGNEAAGGYYGPYEGGGHGHHDHGDGGGWSDGGGHGDGGWGGGGDGGGSGGGGNN